MDAMPNDDTLAMRRDWTNQVIQNILRQASINQSIKREKQVTKYSVQQKILHLSINHHIIQTLSVTLKELSREKEPEKEN